MIYRFRIHYVYDEDSDKHFRAGRRSDPEVMEALHTFQQELEHRLYETDAVVKYSALASGLELDVQIDTSENFEVAEDAVVQTLRNLLLVGKLLQ